MVLKIPLEEEYSENLFLQSKYNDEGLKKDNQEAKRIMIPGSQCKPLYSDFGDEPYFSRELGVYASLNAHYVVVELNLQDGSSINNIEVHGDFTGEWILYEVVDTPFNLQIMARGYNYTTESTQSLNTGLIAYYGLNENANDSYGTNHGTVDGATSITEGQKAGSGAYSFDGINDSISMADSATLDNVGKSITISGWVYPTGTWSASNRAALLGKGGYNLGNGYEVLIRGDLIIEFNINQDAIGTTTALSQNVWTHIIAVFDDTADTMKIYVNGVLEGTNNAATATILDSTTSAYIGVRAPGNSLIGYFKGNIDEVAVWNRALSTSEIESLYEEGAGRTYPFTTAKYVKKISKLIDINKKYYLELYLNQTAVDRVVIDYSI